jgi:hypothetical protein
VEGCQPGCRDGDSLTCVRPPQCLQWVIKSNDTEKYRLGRHVTGVSLLTEDDL